MTLTEKDAEIIWLNMKLGDEKHQASRASLQRDASRPILYKDMSNSSLIDNNKSDSKIDQLKRDRDRLEMRVKELELEKIKLESENDKLNSERDNLKLKIGYLEANSQHPALHNNSMNVDIMLENKATKQRLIDAKDDQSKLLKEQLAEKEKWNKEREILQSEIEKQKRIIADYKQAINKHQKDVEKAIKIHKANENLAQQNVALKKEIDQFKAGILNNQQILNIDPNDKSVSFQNTISNNREFESSQVLQNQANQ